MPLTPGVIKSIVLRKYGKAIGRCFELDPGAANVDIRLDVEKSGRVEAADISAFGSDGAAGRVLNACIEPIFRKAKLPPVEKAGAVKFRISPDALTPEKLHLDSPPLVAKVMVDYFAEEHRDLARTCRAKNPGLNYVMVIVDVNGGGRVTATRMRGGSGFGTTIRDAYECVVTGLKRVTFPKTRSGGTFTLMVREGR